MKIAANVIAVLGWGGFLAALWAALLAERVLPLGMLLAVLAASLFAVRVTGRREIALRLEQAAAHLAGLGAQ